MKNNNLLFESLRLTPAEPVYRWKVLQLMLFIVVALAATSCIHDEDGTLQRREENVQTLAQRIDQKNRDSQQLIMDNLPPEIEAIERENNERGLNRATDIPPADPMRNRCSILPGRVVEQDGVFSIPYEVHNERSFALKYRIVVSIKIGEGVDSYDFWHEVGPTSTESLKLDISKDQWLVEKGSQPDWLSLVCHFNPVDGRDIERDIHGPIGFSSIDSVFMEIGEAQSLNSHLTITSNR